MQLGMHQVYDVTHNTAKEEEHQVNGQKKRLLVHRKGATRAYPPGHPSLPARSPPYAVHVQAPVHSSPFISMHDCLCLVILHYLIAHGILPGLCHDGPHQCLCHTADLDGSTWAGMLRTNALSKFPPPPLPPQGSCIHFPQHSHSLPSAHNQHSNKDCMQNNVQTVYSCT